MSTSTLLPRLPRRAADAHKGTTGTVAVVGGNCSGQARMVGAPAFAALGALRAGCGLAKVLAPAPIFEAIVAVCPSATGIALAVDSDGSLVPSAAVEILDKVLLSATALIIGPGLGDVPETQPLALRAVQQEVVPVIVDADAINALARVPELSRDFRARAILTPHPGEYARLARSLNIDADAVNPATRSAAAEAMALRLGCIVVLKGQHTVVSSGLETWVCGAGHPCLATAGTGDVLGGIIAGLVAQFGPEPHNPLMAKAAAKAGTNGRGRELTLFDLARVGVQVHALAGEKWATMHDASAGLLAAELAELVPGVVEGMRE